MLVIVRSKKFSLLQCVPHYETISRSKDILSRPSHLWRQVKVARDYSSLLWLLLDSQVVLSVCVYHVVYLVKCLGL